MSLNPFYPPPPPIPPADPPVKPPVAHSLLGQGNAVKAILVGGAIVAVSGVFAICYFWFIVVLWLLWGVSLAIVVVFAIFAMNTSIDSERQAAMTLAGLAGVFALGLWFWISSYGLEIPRLSAQSSAKEITHAYRDRVAHIRLAFSYELTTGWESLVEHNESSGSGLLIANSRDFGVVVTNRHVIDPDFAESAETVIDSQCEMRLASEEDWHPASIVALHHELDLAILTVRKRFRARGAVRVASLQAVEQGEEVVALGNPAGFDFVTTDGIVSKVSGDAILTSCPINPGNSGGPLITKNRGYVIGLNTWGIDNLQNFNGAIAVERVLHRRTSESSSGSQRQAGLLDANKSSWTWYADQDQVLKLLATVPLEKSK